MEDDDFGQVYATATDVVAQLTCASIDDCLNETTSNKNTNEVEEEEEMIPEDDGSESEDDLHIVLNDDCSLNPIPPQQPRVNGRGSIYEDDQVVGLGDEDLVIADTHQLQLVISDGGVQQTSAPPASSHRGPGGGNGMMMMRGNYCSQYKYIRPHGAAFPFSAKSNGFGSAVSFPSPSIRCDWDASGGNQQVGSSSGTVASSGSKTFSVPGQTECGFSLPRHRTILNVNIDAFEQKPWKHPEVDTTDFFNFGLDEDGWKHYCNNLEKFWQQSIWATKTNQVYGTGFGHQAVSPETVGRESTQIGEEGGVSPVVNNTIKGERRLDIPQGRAIQVDGGIGERRPSTDIKRTRNRDSDVVIQILVQENNECSTSSNKEELGHSKLDVSENGASSIDVTRNAFSAESTDKYRRQCHVAYVKDMGMLPLKRHSQPKIASGALLVDCDGQGDGEIRDVEGCRLHRAKERTCHTTFEAKERIQRNPFKADPCTLEAESSLGDRVQFTSSLSYSDSYIEVPSIGSGSVKGKNHKPARRQSSYPVNGLQTPITSGCNQSKDSGSSDRKTEHGDNKDDLGNQSYVSGEQDSYNRVRLRSVAGTTNHVGDDEATPMLNRKYWHDENHLKKSSHKRRERQYENDYCYGEDLPYYEETEISFGYRRERFVRKPVRDVYAECFRRKGHTKFRNEMDPCLIRHWDEREFFLDKTYTLRENEAREREHLLSERQYSSGRLGGATQDESTSLTPECSPFYTEKEHYRWQRRKRNDEECFRGQTENADFVLEHRYREQYIQEDCMRPVSFHDREREYLNEKYDRHISYKVHDRRERYGGSPCMDILTDSSRDVVDDDEYWRRFDHESLSPRKEFHITHERRWCDATSRRPAMYDSRRSDGEEMDLWRQTHYEKHQNDGWFDPTSRDSHDADSVIYRDDCFLNEGRGYVRQSKALDWRKDRSSRQRNLGRVYAEEASFSYAQSSRHGAIHIKKYNSSHCGMGFDENWQVHDRNRNIREETRDSGVKTHITSGFDLVDKDRDDQAAPRHNKTVGSHFVGWGGKVSGRCYKAGNTRSHGRKGAGDLIDKKHKPAGHSSKLYAGKLTPSDISKLGTNCLHRINTKIEKMSECGSRPPLVDEYANAQLCKSSVLEDGQLPVQEDGKKEVNPPETNCPSKRTRQSGVTSEKVLDMHNAAIENKIVGGYDNHRILESLAKMERRRERFKEPIALKELDRSPDPLPDIVVEPNESKQQRPTRKRRWGGS